jgi:Inner membrane protein YgaP-like, transmembrane domain
MMKLVRVLQTLAGRLARIAVGIGVIITGVALGGGWLVLVAVGLVPLVAGSAHTCLVAPLFHAPLRSVGRS